MGDNQCYVAKRYVLTALSFLGMFSIFAMRVSLSVTIVAMVNSTEKVYSNVTNFGVECPNLISQTQRFEDKTFFGAKFNWDAQKQGLILGAFYYGYVITQLPGGFLSEKIGAKWLFGGGVLNTAIFNLLTPLIASWGVTALIIVRIIEGLGEGGTFPAINLMISHWSPKMERSRVSTIIFTGNQMGNVLSMPIAGWLSSSDLLGGWPSAFYLFGTMSCIWFVFWAVLVYETPDKHPTISLKELQMFQKDNEASSKKKSDTPWKAIFSSLPMWAVLVAHVGHDMGFLIFLADLPTYLSSILHFNIKANGFLSALPFVSQAITAWIASYFADRLRRSNVFSITNIRKIFTSVGCFGPAVCLLLITVSGCRPYLIVFLITLGMSLNGFVYSGFNVTHVDMSPTFAGTMYAITNTAACFCGFVGPAIVGAFTNKGATIENWNSVFYITAATYVIAAVFFAIFGSAELQPWGTGKENKTQNHDEKKIKSPFDISLNMNGKET